MISIWNHLSSVSFASQNCHRLLGLRRHYETEKAVKRNVKIWSFRQFFFAILAFLKKIHLNLDNFAACPRNSWHFLWGIESIQNVTCDTWDDDLWRFFVVPGTKSGKVREMRRELIGISWITCLRCLRCRQCLRHRWVAALAVLAILVMLSPVCSSGLNLVSYKKFWNTF